VLSRQFLEVFTPYEIRMVLLHEMIHHKRFDPLTHLLSLVVAEEKDGLFLPIYATGATILITGD